MTQNILQPFTFDNMPLRGKILRMADLSSHIPSFQEEAATDINQSLAELLLASALLVDDFKEGCDVSLQIQHAPTGALLLAQCNAQGAVRAYANDAAHNHPFQTLADGQGIFTVTVHKEGSQEPYQSIIPLTQSSAAAALESYFTQAAQAQTSFNVWVGKQEGAFSCGAIFLQSQPDNLPEEDDWRRMGMLIETVEMAEILPGTISTNDLLRRLFNEDAVRLLPAQTLTFQENDARERMRTALASLGEETCREMLEEGAIHMTDAYTGQEETFQKEDIDAIFTKQ